MIYNNITQPKEQVMEKTKRNTTKSPKNTKNIKSIKPKTPTKIARSAKTTKTAKKQNKSHATDNHWIESRARLVKILEATGIQPESGVVMIGCYKKEQRA